MYKLFNCAVLAMLAFVSVSTYGRTAIAAIQGEAGKSLYAAYQYKTQSEADAAAIKGCRERASENKLGHRANTCAVQTRQTRAGFGAISCGNEGCGWSSGELLTQYAVDEAKKQCNRRFTDCKVSNDDYWVDFEGYENIDHYLEADKKEAKSEVEQPDKTRTSANSNCRPKLGVISCKSNCFNGDCVVAYENGCKIRVQVSPIFDPLQNQWTYPTPSC